MSVTARSRYDFIAVHIDHRTDRESRAFRTKRQRDRQSLRNVVQGDRNFKQPDLPKRVPCWALKALDEVLVRDPLVQKPDGHGTKNDPANSHQGRQQDCQGCRAK